MLQLNRVQRLAARLWQRGAPETVANVDGQPDPKPAARDANGPTTATATPAAEPAEPQVRFRVVRYIHIGKTGGSGFRDMINDMKGRDDVPVLIRYMPHRFTISDVAENHPRDGLCFFVREPVARFVSGFNSRQRRGYPRYDKVLPDAEARAFETFASADELALGLADGRPEAHAAWDAIAHVRRNLQHYLISVETLEALRERIVFIGATESYDADIAALKQLLAIPEELAPPTDPVRAFYAPGGQSTEVSPRGLEALRAHMAEDFRIHAWATQQRAIILERHGLA